MNVDETALPGILMLTPTLHRDARGAFLETWNRRQMAAAGLPEEWVQDNLSISRRNVLRGIHYQITQPQGKLVRVAQGAVFDVAVDLRRGSPGFGRHVALELSSENLRMLWIPPGFGHGFLALTDHVCFAYKVTDYYSAVGERTIRWDDPELAIPWPVDPTQAIVSDKDRQGVLFRDAEAYP